VGVCKNDIRVQNKRAADLTMLADNEDMLSRRPLSASFIVVCTIQLVLVSLLFVILSLIVYKC